MVNQYKNKISSLIKNKYREAKYHDKNFFNDFKIFRQTFKKKITKISFTKKVDKRDITFFDLQNTFEKKIFDQKKIESYYRKFENHFNLKRKYNKNLKPLTKEETSFQSYIYLGHLIFKLKRIDIFQKLNIILKILDKLSIKEKQYKYYNTSLLLKLISIEEKLINKILKL